jgi:hypothetical protein
VTVSFSKKKNHVPLNPIAVGDDLVRTTSAFLLTWMPRHRFRPTPEIKREGRREKGEGRRKKEEGRREKGERRRAANLSCQKSQDIALRFSGMNGP